jgi:hypothetical protein
MQRRTRTTLLCASTSLITALILSTGFAARADSNHSDGADSKLVALSFELDPTGVCANNDLTGTSHYSFFRVLPSGLRESTPFKVPGQRRFVITDVVWHAVGSAVPFGPGRAVALRLLAYLDGAVQGKVLISTPVPITNENKDAVLGSEEHLASGFSLLAGRSLCASAETLAVDGSTLATLQSVYVYGYLTQN